MVQGALSQIVRGLRNAWSMIALYSDEDIASLLVLLIQYYHDDRWHFDLLCVHSCPKPCCLDVHTLLIFSMLPTLLEAQLIATYFLQAKITMRNC